MPHLFFAYANSPLDPLETLQEEDDRVHSLLAPRERARHFRLLRDSHVSIPKLVLRAPDFLKRKKQIPPNPCFVSKIQYIC